MAIKKYIVYLPDYIEEDEKTGNLSYNGVAMHPIPYEEAVGIYYEEAVGIYKDTLEFLKVADKYSLEKIYGVSSLRELFDSLPVSDIVCKYKTEANKYDRILELLKDIDICELRSIVNDLYVAKRDEMQRFKDIIRTLKGKSKSESS